MTGFRVAYGRQRHAVLFSSPLGIDGRGLQVFLALNLMAAVLAVDDRRIRFPALAVVEVIGGQLYLAALVARLVSSFR